MLLGFGSVRFKLIALDTDVGPPLLEYPVQGRLGEKKRWSLRDWSMARELL